MPKGKSKMGIWDCSQNWFNKQIFETITTEYKKTSFANLAIRYYIIYSLYWNFIKKAKVNLLLGYI